MGQKELSPIGENVRQLAATKEKKGQKKISKLRKKYRQRRISPTNEPKIKLQPVPSQSVKADLQIYKSLKTKH